MHLNIKPYFPIKKTHLPSYFNLSQTCKIVASILPVTLFRIAIYLFVFLSTKSTTFSYVPSLLIFLPLLFIGQIFFIVRCCKRDENQEEFGKLATFLWQLIMIINIYFLGLTMDHQTYNLYKHYFKIRLPLLMNQLFSILTFLHFMIVPIVQNYDMLLLYGYSQCYLIELFLGSFTLGVFFDFFVFGSDLNMYIFIVVTVIFFIFLFVRWLAQDNRFQKLKQIITSQ